MYGVLCGEIPEFNVELEERVCVCHRDYLEVGGLVYAVLLYVCVRFSGSCLVEEMGWKPEMGKEKAFPVFL
jgi:hypothetical protein